ncbi:MAG: homoserine O-acetyltransferase [Rhodothermales bacterium]|nr:homoserine O-acetyltransferase [Rhodothermales bacterium]
MNASWQIGDVGRSEVRTLIVPTFTTEGGETVYNAPIAYQTWGELNETADNCIVVCHALTGNTDVQDWWGGVLGTGRALDPSQHFVVCLNVPGSPYGSISPLSLDQRSGRRFGVAFPRFTIRDAVRLHRLALEQIGVRRIRLAVGGSLGGMQAVEWCFHTDFVDRGAAIACGANHSAWCIGWSSAQRAAICADPTWDNGNYHPDQQPGVGLALARRIAMMTYRSAGEYDSRFGRQSMKPGETFSVESYLDYQGDKLVSRFDANCYLALTSLMDSHDIERERVDCTHSSPVVVVAVSTDVLYPPAEQQQLVSILGNATYEELESPYGHDAFLIEQDRLNEILLRWLNLAETRAFQKDHAEDNLPRPTYSVTPQLADTISGAKPADVVG